jgi:predicted kinase
MIKLMHLLLEAASKGKMVIMAGGAGAGKSTLVDKIKNELPGFEVMNPDKYVEDESSPMYNSLTQASMQVDDKDVPEAIASNKNFIWDTTASNANKMLGGIYKRKEVAGILNTSNYDTLMIMVYAHPIVSFLRNFKRERKVPKIGIIQTWNNVYGNVDAYKNKLGDNFVLYQAPDTEYQKEIDEFNEAVRQGKLYEWLEELVAKDPAQFSSSFRKTPTEPLSPEEQEKKKKTAEKMKELYKEQVKKLEQEFLNINDKIKDSLSTESEVLSKVKSFAQ